MSLRNPPFSIADVRTLHAFWLLAGCCVWAAGCGVQAYEERLNNANEMFAYQSHLDRILTKTAWGDPYGFGVTMRLPKGFTQIPAPALPAEGAESAEPIVDDRQPTYLGITDLDGLLGAWKAAMPAVDNSQSFVFLYVVSNHQRMLTLSPGEKGLPPGEFLQDLESLLELQLGVTLENGNSLAADNVRVQESIPRDEKFVRRKEFTSTRLVPSEGALQQLGLPELEVYVYEHLTGSVQVAVLLVVPRAIRENPDANLRVALETLTVSDQAPPRAAPGESGAAPRSGGF